jgi:hypothetical protein
MTLSLRVSLPVIVVSLLGCASQVQQVQTSQPPVGEEAQEEQPKKPAMPTFTYRPGW